MRTFILDGRTMQDHYPGIGRYVFNLAAALGALELPDRLRVLYAPDALNTRFDLKSLAADSNLQLAPVAAQTFSLNEQRIGHSRSILQDAALWHAPYYALPYSLPLPLVVTLPDVTPLVLQQEMPSASLRAVYRTVNRLAARRAKRIITLSHASADDFVHALGVPREKITVVPLGVEPRFQPAPAAEIAQVRQKLALPRDYALYLGSNKPHKNIVRLVKAWVQVQTDVPLVIAGSWSNRYPEAQDLVAQLRQEERILFRHNIPESALPSLLSGAQVFCFPSVHEGFGLPPLEAMACGAPVVCASASSLPEVVADAALLFDPLNVRAIADALSKALSDAGLRAKLREKGFAQARTLTWDRTARETLAVYEQVYAHSAHL